MPSLRHVVLFKFRDDASPDKRFVGTLGSCLERSLVLDYWTQS